MAVAQHRAPVVYAVPMPWAAGLALALGLVAGMLVGITTAPGSQGLERGLLLGLILGVPAVVAVVLSRRAVEHGTPWWLVAAIGVGGLVTVAALLFALTQVDLGMAPLGGAAAVAVGTVSLAASLRLAQRRREGDADARRH